MSQIKLVIFDLDGVLVDTKEVHYEALNAALQDLAPEYVISKEDHLTIYDGLSTSKKLDMLVEKGLNPLLKPGISTTKQLYTIDKLDKIKFDPAKVEIFKDLKGMGYKICVASNAIKSTVEVALQLIGVRGLVDYVFSNQDVIHPKPAAEIYLLCCIATNISPTETLIIEDSLVGRHGAKNSGCHVLEVEDENWTRDQLFQALNVPEAKRKWSYKRLQVVIPMAGAGSRFEKAGYTFPKPLIEVRGKPMIQVVVENLAVDARFTFIAQKSHTEKYNLKTVLNLIAPNCNLVQIEGITDGAACTVLRAADQLNWDDPLMIVNSDQFLEFDPAEFYYTASTDKHADGYIVTFKNTHPKWSYAKVVNGYVEQVAEKNPISTDATVGVYYFKHARDFIESTMDMIEANDRTNNEFYVAPVFNHALKRGLKFKTFEIDKMHGIGTPEDLSTFLETYKGTI